LNQVEERTLGVETSFWIAVALTYLEFLEEREVSNDPTCPFWASFPTMTSVP